MRKIITITIATIALIGGLFLAGQIYISNDTLGNILYNIFYFGSIIISIFGIILFSYVLINLFGYSNFNGFNKFGIFMIIIGIIGIVFSFNYINSEDIDNDIKEYAYYLSDHVEMEKGEVPIFNFGEFEKIKNSSGVTLSNPKN